MLKLSWVVNYHTEYCSAGSFNLWVTFNGSLHIGAYSWRLQTNPGELPTLDFSFPAFPWGPEAPGKVMEELLPYNIFDDYDLGKGGEKLILTVCDALLYCRSIFPVCRICFCWTHFHLRLPSWDEREKTRGNWMFVWELTVYVWHFRFWWWEVYWIYPGEGKQLSSFW